MRYQQPYGRLRIDPAWAQALAGASIFNANKHLETGLKLVADTVLTKIGIGANVALGSAQTIPIGVPVTPSWSLLIALRRDAVANYPYFLGFSGGITYQTALFSMHSSIGGRLGWLDSVGFNDSGFALVDGEIGIIGITFDSATKTYCFYKNGQAANVVVGNQTGSGVWQFSSVANEQNTHAIPLLAIVPRVLPPAAMRSATANLWQIFKSPQRVWRAAAGAAAYSLSTAAGTYGLIGQPPALRTARKLLSTSGTYSLAGAVASALRGLQIHIDRGSYAFSGTPAGIVAARRLAASAGAFALSGSAAAQRSARRLSMNPGVYQLIGATAGLVYTPAVVLGAYSLAASSGTFTLAVGAVAYRVVRRLAAAPGAFVLTGPAAALWRGRRSSIASGNFATVGSDIAIRAARRIAADVGTFALTGNLVMLGYSSSVQYARAPAGPGYAPQRAEYQVRPAGEIQRRPTDVQRNER